jgi:acetylornithine deacetylase/succinyl-diaminopimelate desuccinylase-like protein
MDVNADVALTGYLDTHDGRMVEELLEFLRIPSVSTDPSHRRDVEAAASWVAGQLRQAGLTRVDIMETAGHPVVYAEWLGAPEAPTVLVYGHYDVQPPEPLSSWHRAPFEPEIRDDRIYARGVSDDKGPMLIPIKVAEAFLSLRGSLPLNVKFLFEGEEEIGSPSLDRFIAEQRDLLAADFALSADGAMWRIDLPSVIVGSRGLVALNIDVVGPEKDLHSGRHGGAVQNPLHALAALLSSLHRPDGSVAVEGFYDAVREPTEAQRREVASLPFDEEAYRAEIGVPALYGEPGYSMLERLWIRPTLELNGLNGGYEGEGGKTVIPSRAHAKISCRLVPDQEPQAIAELVEGHLRSHAPPGVNLRIHVLPGGAPAYRIDADHAGLLVARDVLRNLYGREPASVSIGGTLPVSEIFARVLGIDTVYFSFSTADEDFHAPNEFFRLSRFRDGLRAWARYWERAASIDRSRIPRHGEPRGNEYPVSAS